MMNREKIHRNQRLDVNTVTGQDILMPHVEINKIRCHLQYLNGQNIPLACNAKRRAT